MPKPRAPSGRSGNDSQQDDDDNDHDDFLMPASTRSLFGGGSCNCPRCMRKAGPIREDTRERIESICYILSETYYDDDVSDVDLRTDPQYRDHWAKATEFMRAVENKDGARLQRLFDSLGEGGKSREEVFEMQHDICGHLVISVSQLGHTELLDVMAQYGDPSGVDRDAWLDAPDDSKQATGLMYATHNGHLATVRKLLAMDADPDARDTEDNTPLIIATFYDRASIAEELLDSGAEVDYRDQDGRTALHHAARCGSVDCIHVLGKHGADPFAKDDEGRTPLDLAEGSGSGQASCEALRKLQQAARMRERHKVRKLETAGNTMQGEDEEILRKREEADRLARQLVEEEEAEKLEKEKLKQTAAKKAAKSQKQKGADKQQQAVAAAGKDRAAGKGKQEEGEAVPGVQPPEPGAGASTDTTAATAPMQPTKASRGASPHPPATTPADTNQASCSSANRGADSHLSATSSSKASDKAPPPPPPEAPSPEEVLREQWEAVLAAANKCTDPALQPDMLKQVSEMLPMVQKAGISVKYGRKVLQKLETLGPARAALSAALAADPPASSADLEAALALARPAIALLEPELIAAAQAALERARLVESHARWEKQAEEMAKAAQSKLANLTLAPGAPTPAPVPAEQQPSAPEPVREPMACPPVLALLQPHAGQHQHQHQPAFEQVAVQQVAPAHPHLQPPLHQAQAYYGGAPAPLPYLTYQSASLAGGAQVLSNAAHRHEAAAPTPLPPPGSVFDSFMAWAKPPPAACAPEAPPAQIPSYVSQPVFTPPAFAAFMSQQQQQQQQPGYVTQHTQPPPAIAGLWGVPSSVFAHVTIPQQQPMQAPVMPAQPDIPAAPACMVEFDEVECVVCMDRGRDVIVMPCFHVCMCAVCAEIVTQKHGCCPMCGVPITGVMEIAS